MDRPGHAQSLLIFTRAAVPGAAKTRLIPALGAEGAAQLHAESIRRTLHWARELAGQGVQVVVHVTGAEPQAMREEFAEGDFAEWQRQTAGDLGQRLHAGVAAAFAAGRRNVVITGTDCPSLDAARTLDAFDQLASADVVLGPAADGGYYLLGLREPCERLFQGIAWGSERVAEQTREAAAKSKLRVAELPVLRDIDCPADLLYWPTGDAPVAARISIIIPTWNEADSLEPTLRSLKGLDQGECLVADGGSSDGTPELAAACGARVVRAPRGRARQQNMAAAEATGELLLFLHADTRLPKCFADGIRAALAEPGVAAGAFRLTFDDQRPALRVIAWGANLRSRWLGLPYGDQALFLRAETFWAVGGFPEVPLLEDLELVSRLRARGRLRLLALPVVTSARRWHRHGILKTTVVHVAILFAWLLGVSPQRLAGWRR